MKITITTPSGNIGSKLADILLKNGEAQITVLAHSEQGGTLGSAGCACSRGRPA